MNRSVSPRSYSPGFTLTELLVVLLIVGVLAALLFSVSDGIFGRGQRERARAELEAIRVALEAYRERFADYPDVQSATQLFQALEGELGPKGDLLPRPYPPFLVAGDFSLSEGEPPQLLDPWGAPYIYRYQAGIGQTGLTSYLLFSAGPDGESSPDGDGSNPTDDDNLRADD